MDMDSTSPSLMKRLANTGDDDAWSRFVELFTPLIFYWAQKAGLNSSEASELVQDVICTVFQKMPGFEYNPEKTFRGWLRTVTINKACDLMRRKAKLQEAHGLEANIETPDAAALFAEAEYRENLVHRALRILKSEFTDATWNAFWQYVAEGRDADQVAKDLEISVNSVYLAKSRVLRRLREEFSEVLDIKFS